MSVQVGERLERRPMSFDDYLALPEGVRAEYADGEAIVMVPSPTAGHQRIAWRLATSLSTALPGLFVVEAVGVWTGKQRSRIPDVMATAEPFDASWSPVAPVLVAEVLSSSTRTEDMVRKSAEYREVGIDQYWIVDRDQGTLIVLRNNGHGGTSPSSSTLGTRPAPWRSASRAPLRSTWWSCSLPDGSASVEGQRVGTQQ